MTNKETLAILTSDWHLSETPPVARSAENSWLKAQMRAIDQIIALQDEHVCPIIHAGDLFDRWNSSPALLNWCLDCLPTIYAIPGQHDMKLHRSGDIDQTAFWTLCLAKKLRWIGTGGSAQWLADGRVVAQGFPFGEKIVPNRYRDEERIHLAVIHRYTWDKGNKHPGATEEQHVDRLQDELWNMSYHCAVVGDNHKGFLSVDRSTPRERHVFVPGTLMRRKSDERDYQPQVGLLHADGSISTVPLDCTEDKWIDSKDIAEVLHDDGKLSALLDELNATDQCALSFTEVLCQYMESHKVSAGVRELVTRMMEQKR